jgi:hypothetical protein
MKYSQRDAVMVTMQLPSGEVETHPFLILSCRSANSMEDFYTGVMMTSKEKIDMFSFEISDSMFEAPVNKHGKQIRLYIIAGFMEAKIERWINKMKTVHFKAVVEQVKSFVLCVDS